MSKRGERLERIYVIEVWLTGYNGRWEIDSVEEKVTCSKSEDESRQ